MILVDTSVWIDHLRTGDAQLADSLQNSQILTHPFVIGELACGNLHNRKEVLKLLDDLPKAPVASNEEILQFIESNRLMGRGVGFIDVHLLASTRLADEVLIWTHDKRLQKVARELKLTVD